MSPKLSPREASRFVDRFRYIICTSQLLSETLALSEYDKKSHGIVTLQLDDGGQGRWDTRKAAKYWMGSGGCVLLVSLLISWALRAPERGISAKARDTATLTLTLLMALFLYAQSRRSYTRLLHSQAATYIQSTVSHCQKFDSITCTFIGLIQEVELVSRGYRIGAVLSPIARIEANARHRRCVRLRTALVSALNLVFTANGRACSVLDQLTSLRDYNKLSDVYNIILTDEDDLSLLCDEADSVAYLKALFQQVHARRRKLLCCLLAIQADGRPGNTRVWRVVVEQLRTISGLMANLVKQLENTLEEDSHVLDPNQLSIPDVPATNDRVTDTRRHQARSINMLSQSLRRTQAKMYILREESSRILQQPDIEPEARSELLDHYDSLGSDLHALLADWQEGRQRLTTQDSTRPPSDSTAVESCEQGISEAPADEIEVEALLIRPDSLGFWGPRMSVYQDIAENGTMFTPIEDALREEVYEADNAANPAPVPSTRMTRVERIAQMRREREIKQAKSEERRKQQEARLNLHGELRDVLGHRSRRPSGLRLSVHNIQRSSFAQSSQFQGIDSPPLADGSRKVSTASQQSANTMNSGLGSSISSHFDH
ncbi:Putative uncharacterized protein [Taphrina deformans PYCC 5710]|uniref:Vezatin n=1 Tax=Taphrina deformans (strain PYCC 5710 / ATCC 11124 / CBS 356.35 / IMI 108563 / JCM 9778 / NBRC 8474) TaxID=1097556 RepID=R4XE88_TAPDE|nr:Putative uncharacterized protein [Taphrina deformans PYCC 5710]|eukprot:CCG81672.1 Putative uncharacterized protein [Taphrina deformans PYCC 5710]